MRGPTRGPYGRAALIGSIVALSLFVAPAVASGGRPSPTPIPSVPPSMVHGVQSALAHTALGRAVAPASPRPAAGINPKQFYSSEPAPMGIADFGVTGTGPGTRAYSYATLSFEATASVQSMKVSTSSGHPSNTAFELNAMLVLRRGGVNFTYWIQNGLHVDANSREYTIGGAYVWNFSGSGATISTGELSGNSSSAIVGGRFIYIPATPGTCGKIPGQCSTLSWPSTLTGRINASMAGGLPIVEYEYNLGSGWVTYDTVSFLHMANATVVGFVVDGYTPTPISSSEFYDAEWDWVGASSTSSLVETSSLALSLDFWNGHNYQAVPSAWDFGGDTGETAANVTESLSTSGPTGAPAAQIGAGPGTLGLLYNESQVGFLNVTAPTVPTGTLLVDGVAMPLVGGVANLTLAAGPYTVSLQNYANATSTVTVVAGQTLSLNLSGAGLTQVEEVGLPASTSWGITIDGIVRTGTSPSFWFTLPNGTFGVTYAPVGGYYLNATDATTIFVPASGPLVVDWSRFTYQVPVDESGLPSGTAWSVTVAAGTLPSTTTSIDVTAPNGSTPFTVNAAYKFVATPASGSIVVTAGHFSPVQIVFSLRPSYIAGSVSPTNASLSIGGIPILLNGGSFNDSVVPGTYLVVATDAGYVSQSIQVTTTPGNVTPEVISLVQNTSGGTTSPPNGNGSTSSSGISTTDVLVIAGVAAAAIVAVGIIAGVSRRRQR